ncbi:hypothetical protein CH75_05935 [Dyella jiangningensis]|nr:hypothetical protein CH75_05935 [Dyella jiangningensis]
MDIIATFLGAFIGVLGWSLLARFSFAIYDTTHKVSLADKLRHPNVLSVVLWWFAIAWCTWLIGFGAASVYFARADSSFEYLAWFFGGVAITPLFTAITMVRGVRRYKRSQARRAEM